ALLAFADRHGTVDGDGAERLGHRLGSRAVGGRYVATAHQARRRQRRRFGHAYRLEREIPVHSVTAFLYRTSARFASFQPAYGWQGGSAELTVRDRFRCG